MSSRLSSACGGLDHREGDDGVVGVLRIVGAAVEQRAHRAEAARAARRVVGVGDELLRVLARVDHRADHAVGAGVERLHQDAGLEPGHAHHGHGVGGRDRLQHRRPSPGSRRRRAAGRWSASPSPGGPWSRREKPFGIASQPLTAAPPDFQIVRRLVLSHGASLRARAQRSSAGRFGIERPAGNQDTASPPRRRARRGRAAGRAGAPSRPRPCRARRRGPASSAPAPGRPRSAAAPWSGAGRPARSSACRSPSPCRARRRRRA